MTYEVIILNWNAVSKLAYCLEALKQNSFYTSKITVIDNASTDGSIEFLKLKKVNAIFNTENKLFTKAYADYLKVGGKDKYFVVMNNDCVVEKNWDKPLIEFMEKNERVGLVAPMLVDITGQQVQNMGGLADFCSHKGGVPQMWKQPEENLWTTGACIMVRRSAFDEVGGFDEQFAFYCSDSDLCLKLGFAGYKVFNIPESKVRHFHMQSTRKAQSEGLPIMQIGQQDQLKFNRKYELHGLRIGQMREPVLEAVV